MHIDQKRDSDRCNQQILLMHALLCNINIFRYLPKGTRDEYLAELVARA